MQIEFTAQEAQVAVQLFDIALKANGLQVANAALHLTNKIKAASDAETAKASLKLVPQEGEAQTA